MKIKHNKTKAKDITGVKPAALLEKANELEKNGELDEAASLYEKIIKADPHRETAYNRLMIILRKQKEYKKELALINKGIKTFKDFYETGSKKSFNKKVEQISKALLKSTGLADKKGAPLYQQEPIGRWARRKQIVEKKING
jgi:tetratricopeptide (TPR) repeat protein